MTRSLSDWSLPLLLLLLLQAVILIAADSDGQSRDSNEVCYDGLGCFRSDGIFQHWRYRPISLLPQSPEKINIQYFLFTRKNKNTAQVLKYKNKSSVDNSNFNPRRNTKILTHGFNQGTSADWVRDITAALLNMEDVNVIAVDWSGGSGFPFTRATANTRVAAAAAAQFLQWLESSFGVRRSSFHILGMSLGAHVAGYIGRRLNGGVGRISAMDPAGPYFENMHRDVRLDETDAKFVDVIHTDGNGTATIVTAGSGFGMMQASGHVDFYPNGGRTQPGCKSKILNWCHHSRGNKLMIATIQNLGRQYLAVPCDSYENFLKGGCSCGSIGCASMGIKSGSWKPNGRKNVKMFLQTTATSPYEVR